MRALLRTFPVDTLVTVPKLSSDQFHVDAKYQPLMRMIGLDAEAVFDHPNIKAWRVIADRQNCTLDANLDGKPVRWHVKRYKPTRSPSTPAEKEAAGVRLLEEAGIPTVSVVAWGVLADRRSFFIADDLAGYRPGDRLMEAGGGKFDELLERTASVAAKLHLSGLHHRDLYLCHFFIPTGDNAQQPVRLIDCARVKRLPRFLTRHRWIVKDLAQFWYSTFKHPDITDAQRTQWLNRYFHHAGVTHVERLRRSIERKVASIGRHDAKLNHAQPNRNIYIPTST